MKPHELTEHLDRYGADLARWPAAERLAAETLLASGAGRADFEALRMTEEFLRQPVAAPSRALLDRVLTIPQQTQPSSLRLGWGRAFMWLRPAPALAVAASLLAGMWVGSLGGVAANADGRDPVRTMAAAETGDIPGLTSLDDQNGDFL